MIETRAVEGLVPVDTSDEAATFESLYRTHAKRIYSLAYRFAGNAAGGGGARLELSAFSGDMTVVVGGAP